MTIYLIIFLKESTNCPFLQEADSYFGSMIYSQLLVICFFKKVNKVFLYLFFSLFPPSINRVSQINKYLEI